MNLIDTLFGVNKRQQPRDRLAEEVCHLANSISQLAIAVGKANVGDADLTKEAAELTEKLKTSREELGAAVNRNQ